MPAAACRSSRSSEFDHLERCDRLPRDPVAVRPLVPLERLGRQPVRDQSEPSGWRRASRPERHGRGASGLRAGTWSRRRRSSPRSPRTCRVGNRAGTSRPARAGRRSPRRAARRCRGRGSHAARTGGSHRPRSHARGPELDLVARSAIEACRYTIGCVSERHGARPRPRLLDGAAPRVGAGRELAGGRALRLLRSVRRHRADRSARASRAREDEFWRFLDAAVERRGKPVRVLLTAPWHARDAAVSRRPLRREHLGSPAREVEGAGVDDNSRPAGRGRGAAARGGRESGALLHPRGRVPCHRRRVQRHGWQVPRLQRRSGPGATSRVAAPVGGAARARAS